MTSNFNVVIANHLEVLADAVSEWIAAPPAALKTNPLLPETILVQSKGMQHWVSMAIAERNGICANVDFPFPNAFFEQLYSQVVGPWPQDDLFNSRVLAFRIMALLPAMLDKAPFAPLRNYLNKQTSPRKHFQLASKIADIFDQYQVFRPEMVLDWVLGRGETELTDQSWQPVLWEQLCRKKPGLNRATMQRRLIDTLTRDSSPIHGLPVRVSVFGTSYLPPFHLQVLAALSHRIPVYLFLLDPCRHYWGDIISDRQWVHSKTRQVNLQLDPTRDLHVERGNRLLASWGEQGKHFFNLIHQMESQVLDLFVDNDAKSLLAYIQQDILDLNDRTHPNVDCTISETDRSIQVHVCHSPMREVEVLYDQLLDRLEKDLELNPRDIIVMTPDMGTYAPYIHAVFGTASVEGHAIAYTVADQGMPQESRLIEGFLRLLEVHRSRFHASQILGLLDFIHIRQRFGIEAIDLPKIEQWLQNANVRWGWDGAHRKSHVLQGFEQNTWRQGLDRLMLGYAMSADGPKMFAHMLPQEGVDAGDSHILGSLISFAETIYRQVVTLPAEADIQRWHSIFLGLLETFFHVDEASTHNMHTLRELVSGLERCAAAAQFNEPIPFEVVRDYLKEALNCASFGTGFISGGVTFCAMLPMRSIPAKIICLLGMSHDAFPKEVREPAFNLLAANPRPGDRNKRDDDKYLFLEALISARQVLYMSYVGRSIQDNSPIPPSVVIDELLEYMAEGFGIDVDRICTIHPLQAFSKHYFDGRHANLFSYSKENFEACLAMGKPERPLPFFRTTLDTPDPGWRNCTFDQLASFYANPARYLLQQRLGIYFKQEGEAIADQENFNLDGLGRYTIKQKLLDLHLKGFTTQESNNAIRSSGMLPHGTTGQVLLDELNQEVHQFVYTLAQYLSNQKATHQTLDLPLGDFHLSGRVDDLYAEKRVVCRLAKFRPQDLLSLFFVHLAMHAESRGQRPKSSTLVFQDSIWQIESVSGPEVILQEYMEHYWQGLTAPLPFFQRTSYAYALKRHNGKPEHEALAAAQGIWYGQPPYRRGECQDLYIKRCFDTIEALPLAFEETAIKIFQPLLASTTRL